MPIRKPALQLFSILCLVLLAAVPQVAFGNFKIIVLPDTQNESQYNPSMFNSQTQWIADNKTALNIAFVAHVGDVVNTCDSATQYGNADSAMDLLDGGGVSYGVSPGNHDQCGSSGVYPTYFGTSRFSSKSYYGGRLDDYNHYFFFSADGMDFIIIFLQYRPGTTQLNWAHGLLGLYPNHRGIVVSHDILKIDNSWDYQAVYTNLSGNPNLFLMLCGHMHSTTDGEALRTETRSEMNPVHIILSDFQDMSNGNGWLRILEFDPSADHINVTTYSPYTGESRTHSDSQYTLDYNMPYPSLYGDVATADCDVDGSDLAAYIPYVALNPHSINMTAFTNNFGKNACQ